MGKRLAPEVKVKQILQRRPSTIAYLTNKTGFTTSVLRRVIHNMKGVKRSLVTDLGYRGRPPILFSVRKRAVRK